MGIALVTTIELHERLVRSGQIVQDAGATERTTDVWPTPETIVTVAANLDPMLMSAYRLRYLTCLLKSPDELVPALQDEPAFALPVRFRRAAAESSGDDAFRDGPFRWFLRRINRHQTILIWPGSCKPGPGGAFAQPAVLEEVPRLHAMLPQPPNSPDEIGAVVLDLGREPDCRIL